MQAAVAALKTELPSKHHVQSAVSSAVASLANKIATDDREFVKRIDALESAAAASRAEGRKALHAVKAEVANRATLSDLEAFMPRSEVSIK